MSAFFEDNKSETNLAGKAVRSGVLSVFARAATGVLQLATTLFLARLLTPEDFGLVAIVLALSGFAPFLIDLGLSDATIQRPKITHTQVSMLFWMSLGLSLCAACLLWLASPLIASIYHQPVLRGIAIATAVSFIFFGLSVQHIALLRRAMRFGNLAVIDIGSYLAGASVAIVMAVHGSGYWALVARQIVTSVCMAAGAWISCNWKPGLPRFDPAANSMMRFGIHVSGYSVTNFITHAVDRAALGLVYGPRLVGFYQNALVLYENSVNAIVGPLHNVGVSALSKLYQEPEELKRRYAMALSNVAFYSMPAFATLAVIGWDLVPWLLGEKWSYAGKILSILAFRGLLHPIEGSQGWLHLALGQPKRWMYWGILTAMVQVVAVCLGLPFGVVGVAVAYVLAGSVLALPSVLYAGRPIHINVRLITQAVGRQFIAGVVGLFAGGGILLLLPESAGRIARIISSGSMCLGGYLVVVVGIFRLSEPLRLGFASLKRFIPWQIYSRSGLRSATHSSEIGVRRERL